jgi:hypothetical protein
MDDSRGLESGEQANDRGRFFVLASGYERGGEREIEALPGSRDDAGAWPRKKSLALMRAS